MGKSLIMHIDEAPWVHGGPGKPDATFGEQLVGDLADGPWVFILSSKAGNTDWHHMHSQDETFYVVEGEMEFGGKSHGPGTVMFIPKETEYSFTAGSQGVRFLNVRHGPAAYKARDGEWIDEKEWLEASL